MNMLKKNWSDWALLSCLGYKKRCCWYTLLWWDIRNNLSVVLACRYISSLFFHFSYQRTPDKVFPALTGTGYTFISSSWAFPLRTYSRLLLTLLSIVYFNSLSGHYFKKMGEEKAYDLTISYERNLIKWTYTEHGIYVM